MFLEEDALRHLLHSRVTPVAAIVPFDESMEGSAVLLTDSDLISEFRMRLTGANLQRMDHGFSKR